MSKVMIIAELSANHNGNKQIAIDTIVAAKKSGADAGTMTPFSMCPQILRGSFSLFSSSPPI